MTNRLKSSAIAWLAVAAVGALFPAASAYAQIQSSDKAACIDKVNKAGSKVARAQGSALGRCLKDAAKGLLPGGQGVGDCVAADDKVARAAARVVSTDADRCLVSPDFGFSGAAATNAAATDGELALAADVFGPDLDAAVILKAVDAVGAGCQSKTQKAYEKVVGAALAEFVGCKKRGLKDASITSSATLADCADAITIDERGRVARAELKLARIVVRKCPLPGAGLDAVFPGECAGAPSVAGCVSARARCRACLMLSAIDAVSADCDTIDDGLGGASCPGGPSPSTSTTLGGTTTTSSTTTVTSPTTTSSTSTSTSTTTTSTSSTTTTTVPASCGNGSVEAGEDCDDGNNDPGDCCSPVCAFEAASSACTDDGNVCTDNLCDGAGTCVTTANSAACDDGVFCNGTDGCAGGSCAVHAGDPCSGGAQCSNVCDEGQQGCDVAAGTPCDDGAFCTATDQCDGNGSCVGAGDPCSGGAQCDDVCDEAADDCHSPDGTGCDDGLFCTQTDTCDGAGACTGSGDPCPGADGDGDCAEGCDEGGDSCTAPDLAGTLCEDGLFCTATDLCDGAGGCLGNGNPCTGGAECDDTCDELVTTCAVALGTVCSDDGDAETSDQCDGAGACSHPPLLALTASAQAGVRVVVSNSAGLIDIDAAETALAADVLAGDGRGVYARVDHGNVAGHFSAAGKAAYPGAVGTDQALEATGMIEIPVAGDYVVGVNSDDGFRLRLGPGLPVVSEFTGITGGSDTGTVVRFAAAGSYPFRLTQFQGGGDRFVELYAKTGTSTVFNGEERLVGDTGSGGLAVHASDVFSVRKVVAGSAVSSLAGADAVLAGTGAESEATDQVAVIDFADGGGTGHYGATAGYPGGGGDDFAVEAVGVVLLPHAGTWTFGVHVDDGARLTVGGVDVIVDDVSGTGAHDTFGVFNAPSPGLYDVRLVAFERSGSAQLELFAARGSHGSFDAAAFRLLGDAGAGGLPVFLPKSAVPPVKKVLILGVDGCRPDALQVAGTPNFDQLVADGAASFAAQTGDETWSGPGWSSMLTGVWRDKHGVDDNTFSGSNYGNYPHFFTLLKQQMPMKFTTSLANWSPINDEILSGANYEVDGVSDGTLVTQAVDRLLNHDDDVIFVAFNDVDAAGHSCCFDPGNSSYINAIENTDSRVGSIMAALNARPGVIAGEEDWLVLSSTDHGGTFILHGSDVPEHRTIYYIASGPSAKQGGVIHQPPGVVDVAATALVHMGVSIDPAWELDGRAAGLPTQTVYGENLVFNGDAEYSSGYSGVTNDGSNGGDQIGAGIAGWLDINSASVVLYGSPGFIGPGDPGPPARGSNFFVGGDAGSTTITQTVDIADVQGDVDAGNVDYDLSAYLGGFGSQNDRAELTALFLDAGGTVVGLDKVGPVSAADRGNLTSMLLRQAGGDVPAGTRRVRLELLATRDTGGVNDAYADDLSLVLSAAP